MEQSKKSIGIANDRIVMLEDVLINSKDRLVDSLPVDKEHIFKSKPNCCPHCHSNLMSGVLIMGAYSDNLLWECDNCESMFLRFKVEETEEYLQKAKGSWTNPSDWIYVPKSEFN